MIKFISTSYFPQDRDIVREMWVHGDLKERLGIKHRREQQRSAQSDMEQAPMFHRPHFRSESEISSFHPDPDHGSPALKSPLSSNGTTPPQSVPPSPAPVPYENEMITPVSRTTMTPSPWRGSYYSASNIPVPSPTPGPQDPPMSSISSYPVAPYAQPASNTLQVPGLRGHSPNPNPEMYEMHVRSGTEESSLPDGMYSSREATDTSYATAYDGIVLDLPYDAPMVGRDNLTPGHPPEESWRESTYSTYSTNSGPTVL